jgi:hypothetical protein
MGNCLACGHEYERHVFGGMCFYCDCKRAMYNTDEKVLLRKHEPEESTKHENGASEKGKKPTRRLGNK